MVTKHNFPGIVPKNYLSMRLFAAKRFPRFSQKNENPNKDLKGGNKNGSEDDFV